MSGLIRMGFLFIQLCYTFFGKNQVKKVVRSTTALPDSVWSKLFTQWLTGVTIQATPTNLYTPQSEWAHAPKRDKV